jgi:hypothetical protein
MARNKQVLPKKIAATNCNLTPNENNSLHRCLVFANISAFLLTEPSGNVMCCDECLVKPFEEQLEHF